MNPAPFWGLKGVILVFLAPALPFCRFFLLSPLWGKAWAGIRYVLTRRGPLAMSVNQAGAFLRSRPELPRPNMHIYFNPISYTATAGPRRKLLKPDPYPAFLMSFNTCRPTSRGTVAIRAADPLAAPAIRTNYLSTPEDVADVYDGARVLRSIAAARPLSDVIEREYQPPRKNVRVGMSRR